MKKILFLLFFANSMIIEAQKDVTKFLGIPVDGYKTEMIKKLKEKGYQYNSQLDCMTGEFNGRDVYIRIATNNNKVWRIVVVDASMTDETDIKIRFNKLCLQFLKNDKYVPYSSECEIPDEEDISYEMTVNNKRYEASFYQKPIEVDTVAVNKEIESQLLKKFTKEQLSNPTEVESAQIGLEKMRCFYDYMSKKSVWFMIDGEYEKYQILLFYDNEYNHSDGEDL